MAFAVTLRANTNSDTAAVGSQVSASFTPTANSRLFVFAAAERDNHTATRAWGITNTAGLTFTKLDESTLYAFDGLANYGGNCVAWYADIGASPASMTVTVDASASGNDYYALIAFDVTGYNTSSPFPQASVDNGSEKAYGDTETGTLTLGSAPTSGNLVVAMYFSSADSGGIIATPSGYTALLSQNFAYCREGVFYHTSTTTAAVTSSDLGDAVGTWGGIIFEMALAAGGGSPLSVSVSDSATAGESRTVSVTRNRSVSDSITAIESVKLQRISYVAVADSVVATDTPSLSVGAAGALTLSVSDSVTVNEFAIAPPIGGACINGVLTVNGTNGRYFQNNDGPVILSGFHTWYLFQDAGPANPPATPDYNEWLDYCDARGTNWFKIWHMETAKDWPDMPDQYFALHPWQRTGPGNAADGHPKFDLDTWEQGYFDRLRRYVILAGNRGYYVTVQFYQGFHIELKGHSTGDPWGFHPMENGNNINSIDGDTDNDGAGEETRDGSIPAIQAYQEAYVERVLDLLNDLDNVIYEVENEGGTYAVGWQQDFVDHIQTYESGLAKQHPVGLTKIYPGGSNSTLEYNNEWLSYDATGADAVADGTYVSAYDTDHTVGIATDYFWIWKAYCNGHGGIWYMDEYDGADGSWPDRRTAPYDIIRNNTGYIQSFVADVDKTLATPQPSLSDTGYCLAKTTGAPHQYVAYQDASGALDVTLTGTTGVLTVEWLRTTTGATSSGGTVNGGAIRTLTPPWAGEDVVVYLWQSTYAIVVADSATASEQITVSVETLADLAVSVADSAAASELVALLVESYIAVVDSATASESVTLDLLIHAQATDATTASESITLDVAVGLVVADSATITESVALDLLIAASVTDAITASETVALLVESYVSVSDAVAGSESIAFDVPVDLSVADSVTADEQINLSIQTAGVVAPSVNDSALVSESITLDLPVDLTVADAATVSESITAEGVSFVSVADAIAANESIAVALPVALAIADSATVGESVAFDILVALVVTDSAAATEDVTLSVQAAGESSLAVSDGVTVGETVTIVTDDLALSVADSASVGESVTVTIEAIGAISINVSDSATAGESVNLAAAINVSVSDGVVVAESTAMVVAIDISVADAATLLDSVALMLLHNIMATDSATVSESLTVDSLQVAISVTDTVSALDTISVGGQTWFVNVSDSASLTEALIIAVITGIVPTSRIYAINGEDRVYPISGESRVYAIQ